MIESAIDVLIFIAIGLWLGRLHQRIDKLEEWKEEVCPIWDSNLKGRNGKY